MESPAFDLRKAAVLLACLDDQTARQLFRRLDAADQRRLANAAGSLGPIDPHERDAIVAEFDAARRSLAPAPTSPQEQPEAPTPPESWDGIELAGSLGRTLGQTRRESAANGTGRPAPNGRSVDRAVALLAALPAPQAADMLARWEASLRAAALRRLLDAEHDQQSDSNGASLLAKILAAAPAETAQEWLELAGEESDDDESSLAPSSARRDVDLDDESSDSAHADSSAEIGEQLARLDDASLAAVLRSVDVQVAVVALAGCDPSLAAKLLERLPPRESQLVACELQHLTGVRLADVEAAQREIARHIRGLLGAVRVTAD
ncbi:MAG TPA: FliG C-terminal domain-containing protein [Pirellulales bacterium]